MTREFSPLDAAVRALHGECDLDVVRPALGDVPAAKSIALAPDADPIMRAVAALCSDLRALINARITADPALHDAVVRLIGTPEGQIALDSWAQIAPAGWGAGHVSLLIDAVRKKRCRPGAAAALIGPCDESARLLRAPSDVEFAIRHWGRSSSPDAPTAWKDALSLSAWHRMWSLLSRDERCVATCLPWLSPSDFDDGLSPASYAYAFRAFVKASDAARQIWADMLSALIRSATRHEASDLVRFAEATARSDAWDAVMRLINDMPHIARFVVQAARWDVLPDTVQRAMMTHATSPACATIAHARGIAPPPAGTNEWRTFFAAVKPDVWDSFDADMRRTWLRGLSEEGGRSAWIAVRSLGLRPEVLALANGVSNDLIDAAQGHVSDESILMNMLFPIAVCEHFLTDAYVLMAALPREPRDPNAFFVIASRGADQACMLQSERSSDLAARVTLQRVASGASTVDDCCEALTEALRQRTWDDVHALTSTMSDADRKRILPDREALVNALAHPRRRVSLQRALDALASLPPETSMVALFALSSFAATDDADERRLWVNEIALSLRSYGRLFVSALDAMNTPFRSAFLPPPFGSAIAAALRRGMPIDPLSAVHLAKALPTRNRKKVMDALLIAPSDENVRALLAALPQTVRSAWIDDAADWISPLAATDHRESLRHLCSAFAANDPVALLALMAIASDDPEDNERGVHMLSRRREAARIVLPLLRRELRKELLECDALYLTVVDIDAGDNDVHQSNRHRWFGRSRQ